MGKRVLITGINGMDGSFLADFLLEKGYEVYGMERRSSSKNRTNTGHLEGKITFVNGDLGDQNSLLRCLKESNPEEVYNLASQSFVGESWNTPEQTGDVTGLGVLRMLEAIREYGKPVKFYQASTSEMFGKVQEVPQNELTRFYPRSPYGVSKLFAHYMTINYRESYDLFTCSGILFNHESPLRGNEFVTKKIIRSLNRIKEGREDCLYLGNIDSKRDWGHAKDYVEAMWLMLDANTPDDYVVSSGTTTSVKKFIEITLDKLGFNYEWTGDGINNSLIDKKTSKEIIKIDKSLYRPAEVDLLIGDSSKIRNKLKWNPLYSLENLIDDMINFEISNSDFNF